MSKLQKIYNGKLYCDDDGCDCGCPVVEYDEERKVVFIYDPDRPKNGKYQMTPKEYNDLLQNAKPVNKDKL